MEDIKNFDQFLEKSTTQKVTESIKVEEIIEKIEVVEDNSIIDNTPDKEDDIHIESNNGLYKIYRDISEEKYRQIMEREVLELTKYDMEEIDEKTYKKNVYNIITDIAGNDFEIKEEVIKMNMIKKEKWDMEDNSDLIQRLYPAIFYMMESLNKRYFKTSEEGNI